MIKTGGIQLLRRSGIHHSTIQTTGISSRKHR
jgi:hypothetical protein